MNRRDFSLQLAGASALGGLGLLSAPVPALAAPVAGQDYTVIKTPVQLARTGKVEVIEFFWYGCPHCFHFEPVLEPWIAKLPADVHMRRVPVAFDALKEVHQQIYYTWEVLGLIDPMHTRTFDRFHKARNPINTEADMMQFARENGLDVAKVKGAWDSFGVQTKMRQATQLSQQYGIDGVPTLAVQGRFLTSPADAKGETQALAVTDYLINLVRKGG